MTYTKTNWTNKLVEKPMTFLLQQNADGTVTLNPQEGTVTDPGTPVNAQNMNNIEQGITDAQNNLATHTAEKASQTQLGHVQIGNGINVDANGVISTSPPLPQVGSTLFLYNNAWGGF